MGYRLPVAAPADGTFWPGSDGWRVEEAGVGNGHLRIGEVAERTGLSLRTIRYYEEVGLVAPSARSRGGFRLYTDADVERLLLVKRMKPLDFTLEEMRDLLDTLSRMDTGPARRAVRERVEMYRAAVGARCEALREQLAAAQEFAADLDRRLTRPPATSATRARRTGSNRSAESDRGRRL